MKSLFCWSTEAANDLDRLDRDVACFESGLEAKDREKRAFFELADQLPETSDFTEQMRLKEELARLTFGEP